MSDPRSPRTEADRDDVTTWKAAYLSLLDSWTALCDLAGVEGDSAPGEVIAAIKAAAPRSGEDACWSCHRPYADEAEARCGWCGAEAAAPRSGEGLESLRTLSDAATPGPWTLGGFADEAWRVTGPDVPFIVAAVNYVRAALAAPRSGEGLDDRLVRHLTTWVMRSGWVRDYEHARAEAEGFANHFAAAPREASEPDV